jgi:cobalt-zinc-cadmium efflux system outer membrane protein
MLLVLSIVLGAASSPVPEPAPATLVELVREALDRNPEVQMIGHKVEARRARIPQAGALPDPTLMYGVTNEGGPLPFQSLGRSDFSEFYLGVSQEIPYPGKRGLREKVARAQVTAEEWAYEAARRRVAAQVAETYHDLAATEATVAAVEESRILLDQLSRVATSRFSVGQSTQHDVFDAEVELSQVLERASTLVQRRSTEQALLAQLAYRSAPVAVTTTLTAEREPLPDSLEALLARALEGSPVAREGEAMVAEAERKLELAQREKLPDLGLSVTYHNRGSLPAYYAYGGTLTLPVHAGRKQNKAIEEATAELASARSAADAARAKVRYEVSDAYLQASTADRLLRLYDEALLKQARLSLDSAIAHYQVGKVDFLTVVSSWRRLLDFTIAYREQVAARAKALARLAVHVGPPASAAPIAELQERP